MKNCRCTRHWLISTQVGAPRVDAAFRETYESLRAYGLRRDQNVFPYRAVVAPTGAELYQLGIESDFPAISGIHLRDPGDVLERTETS